MDTAGALGRLGERSTALSVLSAIIAETATRDHRGRVLAAKELAQLGEIEAAVAALMTLAKDQTFNTWSRKFAVEELDRLGEMGGAASALTSVATDPAVDADVRASAAELLRRSGQTAAATAALTAIATDPTAGRWGPAVCGECAGPIGRQGTSDCDAERHCRRPGR